MLIGNLVLVALASSRVLSQNSPLHPLLVALLSALFGFGLEVVVVCGDKIVVDRYAIPWILQLVHLNHIHVIEVACSAQELGAVRRKVTEMDFFVRYLVGIHHLADDFECGGIPYTTFEKIVVTLSPVIALPLLCV